MEPKPLAIELFAGLHGWGEGFAANGYRVVGFDIVDMCKEIGVEKPRGVDLVLQDVATISGHQFRNATVILASPPCPEYSLFGMKMFHPNPKTPDKSLWEASLRIASEAGVPIIIENVRGAQYFWGKAAHHCGPYYLWGNVPAIFPDIPLKRKSVVDDAKNGVRRGIDVSARFGSQSDARKRCTALAAKIPFEISSYIAKVFRPA